MTRLSTLFYLDEAADQTGISDTIYVIDLKLNLPGGPWRQSLGEAGPHQVFRKESSDKNPNALKYLHFSSKTRAKDYHPAGREFETPDLHTTKEPQATYNH